MHKAVIVSALCVGCALGQNVVFRSDSGPVGITTALAGKMENIAGAPYSAEAVTERVQLLADGNRIVQTTSGNVARDSQGRVRREESLPGFASANADAPHIVMIDDPVGQVHWTLDARTKTAMKMPVPAGFGPAGFGPSGFGPSGSVSAGVPGKQAAEARATMATVTLGAPPPLPPGATTKTWFTYTEAGRVDILGKQSAEKSVSKTDLGTQTMEGLPAKGTQTKFTIPAGQVGNDQPIVITTETWYSPDLKVTVMSKSNDPRMGETTYKLTNIQRAEPVPSLFQPPDDYAVKEGPQMLTIAGPKN